MSNHPMKFKFNFWAKWNLSYAHETVFSFKAITLTFDPVTPKAIGFFYLKWAIIL